MTGLLIADDEDFVRATVLKVVSNEALQLSPIREARTGHEAVSLARQMQPDIILMDVKMPGMNGLEATRLIRADLPKVKVVILTAYDEFAYSQEALRLGTSDYLLKPLRPVALVEALTRIQNQIISEQQQQHREVETINRLRATLPLVEAGLVHDLVFKTTPATVETMAECLRSCLGKEINGPAVLIVELDDSASLYNDVTADSDGHLSRLLTDIVRSAVPDPEHALVGQIEPGVVAVIVSTDGKLADPQAIRSLGHAIRSTVESSAPVTVTVSIGRRYASLDLVHVSYAEAMRAQWGKVSRGGNLVIHSDDMPQASYTDQPYFAALEQQLVKQVQSGRRDESKELLGQMVNQLLLASSCNPPGLIQTRLVELTALLSLAVIEGGASSRKTLKLSHQRVIALNGLRSRADLCAWATESLELLMSQMGTRNHEGLIETIGQFVRENFHKPNLSLKDVAAAVHISPSYFTHLVSAKMGISFVKYLTRLRMEEAKRLLSETDLKVSAIAKRVGYEDAAYFHRVFHRETGITPSDFRRRACEAGQA